MLLECPNCQSLWSMEEIDWQECDSCGYPNNEDDGFWDDEDEYDYEAE